MAERKSAGKLLVKIEFEPCADYSTRIRRVVEILLRSQHGADVRTPPKERKGDDAQTRVEKKKPLL